MKFFFPVFLFFNVLFISQNTQAQILPQRTFSYTNPEEYTIGGITFTGLTTLDGNALMAIAGLKVGDVIQIPGEDITNAIKKIWDQKLVGDVTASVTKIEGNKVYLNFHLQERPRVSQIEITGIKKSDKDEIKKKIDLHLGQIITDATIKNAKSKIKAYFIDKGFLKAKANITIKDDTARGNTVDIKIAVDKGKRVRIHRILIHGNENPQRSDKEQKLFSDKKLKKKMKKTKEKRLYSILTTSKFIAEDFEKDKQAIIDYYNSLGFRDAKITKDTSYFVDDNKINIEITIDEGNKYYFRNITWQGNYIYPDKVLDTILNIKKGDVYNLAKLQTRLNYNPSGYDISSLYLDDGYLFFHVEPVEVSVENDSIDIEMRIYEGPQATIKNITISGNTKTHDRVILRELKTLPGQKFSRADLIRSQREIATLGFFDPEKIGINPVPNPTDGTVDINYSVVEKPSDQVQLSGGWGGSYGFVGTLGLVFNNFSIRNVPKFKTWAPLPSGDGQRLAINFQASGRQYQTYSLSFTEPWLGGKKPQSLSVSLTRSQINNIDPNSLKVEGHLRAQGVTVSFGKRLKWPDDYFALSYSASYMQYVFKNYGLGGLNQLGIDNTSANNLNFTATLSRNSLDDFTFPTRGSSISIMATLTPPYSVFNNKDYSSISDAQKYKLVEYHKWMWDNSWFTTLIPGRKRSLVLNTRAHFGFIGGYTTKAGVGPFERFIMGGSGFSNFSYVLGSDYIGLRGYQDQSILPQKVGGKVTEGGVLFNKFVAEIRYPINLSPALSIIGLTFLEAGNTWNNFKDYNPFNLYRSAGVGARIMMPAFGMIGIDWGYRLDDVPGSNPLKDRSHVTFVIGQQIR